MQGFLDFFLIQCFFFLMYRLNTWFYRVTVQSLSFFDTYQLAQKPINSLTHPRTHLCCRDWNDVTLANEAAIAKGWLAIAKLKPLSLFISLS